MAREEEYSAEALARTVMPAEAFREGQASRRYLSELRGVFASPAATEQAMQSGDPLVYSVIYFEAATGDGQLHYGLGVLMPGKVGVEYYLTRGHLHAFRPAAEVYLCLRGQGLMLLEDERSGACRAVEMAPDSAIYVPGYCAHRTVNIGNEPLVYWGVIPHNAGHDYESIRQRNFRQVAVCIDGKPVVMDRADFLKRTERKNHELRDQTHPG